MINNTVNDRTLLDLAMVLAITLRLHAAEYQFRFQTSIYGTCCGQSATREYQRGSTIREGFPPRTSVFPCQYHSINAPYSI